MNVQHFLVNTLKLDAKYYATLLKHLYDQELIIEQTFLDWAEAKIDIKTHFLYK